MKSVFSYDECLREDYSKYSKIVVVGGCFDILHFGHLSFLDYAKEKGRYLIVFLESDQFIKEVKKREPIHQEKERAFMLSLLRCVDQVIILPRMKKYEEYERLVHHIKPSIVAVTEGDPQTENKIKMVEKVGGKVEVVSTYIPQMSSSEIRRKLEKME